MTEIKNIFDLKNLSDLPEDVAKTLPKIKTKTRILDLFDIESQLNITQIKVGLYRQYKLNLTKGCISVHLYYLHKQGLIKNIMRGLWAKNE